MLVMNDTGLNCRFGKELQLAVSLVELGILDCTYELTSKVSKTELIKMLSEFNINFFTKYNDFVIDYINNHIKFKEEENTA